MSDNSRLVYSTETGRIDETKKAETIPETDGIVRIRRETKGRKGKGATCISGLGLAEKELKELAKALKKRSGSGGTVKDHVIEMQGDQRELAKAFLEQKGFTVKLAGG
ncbi:stress response translation initiation inhibitor YciH [Motilimonas sp. 1_MG-2023]|uniref:stress response translation initiation inhibitor YciH n=1 Tax=Motilimonas sp. 1_MG-2023 TaxID=3062672 RepID=UPI0026E234FB|nr:stress response translation initiation inhibitor YciH [Motilimonas sp. 1_MG-2023]MDO6526766.1 stress response translation initiation inhibitor YciH [Motilimonas sp. 1_MG-2023]